MEVNVSSVTLIVLNCITALVMFGVSLSLKADDFVRIIRSPKAPLVGMIAQFIILPALSALAAWLFNVPGELALGMILIASCPGGSFSNIVTFLAKGNVAVSVSMTAVSSLAAIIMTPFNFTFYGSILPQTAAMMQEGISIDPLNIFTLVFLLLAVPLALGMFVGTHFPWLVKKLDKPLRIFSLLVMFGFLALVISNNKEQFVSAFGIVAVILVCQNSMALLIGNFSAKLAGLPRADQKAVTLEVGIQNSALAFSIIYTFYQDMFGMMQVAGLWGVWHLVTGLGMALLWGRDKVVTEPHVEEQSATDSQIDSDRVTG